MGTKADTDCRPDMTETDRDNLDSWPTQVFTLHPYTVSTIDSLSEEIVIQFFWSSILHKQFKIPSRWIDNFYIFSQIWISKWMMQKELASKKESLYYVERQKVIFYVRRGLSYSIIYHCYLQSGQLSMSVWHDTILLTILYPYLNIITYLNMWYIWSLKLN